MTRPDYTGVLLVVSAPSGTGKTTLCRRLVDEFEQLSFSISYTTRPLRGSEQQGVDYHFVDDETFSAMVQQDQFAEWAPVHDHRYGTSRATVEQALAAGRDLVFDIDYQGGNQLMARYAEQTASIFVLPPSMEELSRRLRHRGTDLEDVVRRRLHKASEELLHYADYHYLVVNDTLERAYSDVRSVYRARQLTCRRQAHLAQELISQSRPKKMDLLP